MPRIGQYAAAFSAGFVGVAVADAYAYDRFPRFLSLMAQSEETRFIALKLAPAVMGGSAFLLASRFWQISAASLGITGRGVTGAILGSAGVAFSSIAASTTVRFYYAVRALKQDNHQTNQQLSTTPWYSIPTLLASPATLVKDALIGLAIFSFLGGRTRQILPSHALAKGVFANSTLPPATRETIDMVGRLAGCHTCGSQTPKRFIPSLYPPTEVAARRSWFGPSRILEQKLLPQCEPCHEILIKNQSLTSSNPWNTVVTHVGTARPHDATGFLLALVMAPVLYKDCL